MVPQGDVRYVSSIRPQANNAFASLTDWEVLEYLRTPYAPRGE